MFCVQWLQKAIIITCYDYSSKNNTVWHFPDKKNHVVCFAHVTAVISSFNNYYGTEQNFELICLFTTPCIIES